MDTKKRLLFAGVMLVICSANYMRLPDSETVRGVAFLQIFAIGALSAIVIREVLGRIKNK